MVMNGMKFIVLFLQALQVLSVYKEPKFPTDCGHTPLPPTAQIVNGHIIDRNVFSWMASLRYSSQREDGVCGGSVINSRYVLTAAHCVTGDTVKPHGRLTGVRLGDFSKDSCDYGTSDCASYLHFGIEDIITHENYSQNKTTMVRDNDIALIRLDRPIPLNDELKPICLPNENVLEPVNGEVLTVAGWGKTMLPIEIVAKRAVGIPLINNSKICEHVSDTKMCAGVLGNLRSGVTSCDGDSGGPLMKELDDQKMAIEGIVSFGQGFCVNRFFPTHYTRVRYYLSWIEEHVHM